MKLRSILFGLALATATACAAQAVSANTPYPGMYPNGAQGGMTAQDIPRVNSQLTAQQMRNIRQQNALIALRRDAAALQQQDGGTLTNEHRAMLQARLNQINVLQSTARNN